MQAQKFYIFFQMERLHVRRALPKNTVTIKNRSSTPKGVELCEAYFSILRWAISIAFLTMFPQSRLETEPQPSCLTLSSTPSSLAISYLSSSLIIECLPKVKTSYMAFFVHDGASAAQSYYVLADGNYNGKFSHKNYTIKNKIII